MQINDKEDLVMYLDRKVPRKNFRAYVYSRDGQEKIAESYEEYELCISGDKWFSTKEETQEESEKDKKIARKNVPRGA